MSGGTPGPSLDALVRESLDESLTLERVDDLVAVTDGSDRASVFNDIMIVVAKRFLAGELRFWDADIAANHLYPLMLDDTIERDVSFPSPAYEIFEAFDAGEWDHGEPHKDPIERFTRPLLQELVG